MSSRLVLIVSLILALWPVSARADLIINVGDAMIAPGGTGSIDVSIESDSANLLQSFGFDFRITTGGATRLEFVDPQSDSQLSDSSYLFNGDSFAQVNGFPVGTVSTTSVPNDTFIGGDSTNSFADVNLTSSKLLLSLDFTALTALPPQPGDTFTITLDDTSLNTFFFDSAFNPATINTGASKLSGTVTTTPEPSTLLLLAVAGGIAVIYRGRRVRTTKRQASRRDQLASP